LDARVILFFFYSLWSDGFLGSFPTRRSSDLTRWWGREHNVGARHAAPLRSHKDYCAASPATEPGIAPTTPRVVRWPSFSTRNAVDRKSTRLNSSHVSISYAVFCLKKKKQ